VVVRIASQGVTVWCVVLCKGAVDNDSVGIFPVEYCAAVTAGGVCGEDAVCECGAAGEGAADGTCPVISGVCGEGRAGNRWAAAIVAHCAAVICEGGIPGEGAVGDGWVTIVVVVDCAAVAFCQVFGEGAAGNVWAGGVNVSYCASPVISRIGGKGAAGDGWAALMVVDCAAVVSDGGVFDEGAVCDGGIGVNVLDGAGVPGGGVLGEDTVGYGGLGVFATNGTAVRFSFSGAGGIAVLDSEAGEDAVCVFTAAKVEGAIGGLAVDYTVLGAVLAAKGNCPCFEVNVAVSLAGVGAIGDPDSPAIPGAVYCLLNGGVLSGDVNVTRCIGCECIARASVVVGSLIADIIVGLNQKEIIGFGEKVKECYGVGGRQDWVGCGHIVGGSTSLSVEDASGGRLVCLEGNGWLGAQCINLDVENERSLTVGCCEVSGSCGVAGAVVDVVICCGDSLAVG